MNIEQFIDITIRVVANWEEAAKKKNVKKNYLGKKRTKMLLLTLRTGKNSDTQKSKWKKDNQRPLDSDQYAYCKEEEH